MDEYLTIKEISSLLKVNIVTVRRWVNKGILPAIKLDKNLRVLKQDLEKFIDERRITQNGR